MVAALGMMATMNMQASDEFYFLLDSVVTWTTESKRNFCPSFDMFHQRLRNEFKLIARFEYSLWLLHFNV
jgi:hypothetical protein